MPLRHIALALLVILVWGFNFVVIEIALHEISPLLLGAARFFLTSIPAIFFVKRPEAPFKQVALYGLFMFAFQFMFLFIGMYLGVPAGLSALLLQLQVFFTVILAALFLHEKIHPWLIVGGLMAFTGMGIVALNFGKENVAYTGFWLVIAAAASWSMGNLISKKIGKVNMAALIIWGSLIAWPPLLAASFIVDGPKAVLGSVCDLNWAAIGAVLYITYLSTLFGFGTWSWLLCRYQLATIAPFSLLTPIVAILSSVLVLGELLEGWKICAAILVITGVCLNILGPRLFAKKSS